MPISFAHIATNTATVTFAYAGENVTVVYYPGRLTEKTFAQLQGLATMAADTIAEGFGVLNTVLVTLIKSWDVYDDDAGTVMFPLDPVRLAELPIPFRTQVIQAIMGDIRPEAMAATPN